MTKNANFDSLVAAAARYGHFSLENYALIRSKAENIAAGFCKFLESKDGPCCYLVPPEGNWAPTSYRSGAFSVSGGNFLPLEPISFGLAVRVSETEDWVRVVLTCAKTGDDMDISIKNGRSLTLPIPLQEEGLQEVYQMLHQHLLDWFNDRADRFEHGDYAGNDIGFDFLHHAGGTD
jgi:hypothetical protein